jgi:hypothetical protein
MSTSNKTPVAPAGRKVAPAAFTKKPPVIRGSAAPATEMRVVDPSKVKTRQPALAETAK